MLPPCWWCLKSGIQKAAEIEFMGTTEDAEPPPTMRHFRFEVNQRLSQGVKIKKIHPNLLSFPE
jgi:hypothetical protein